jgi:hypothetical protein
MTPQAPDAHGRWTSVTITRCDGECTESFTITMRGEDGRWSSSIEHEVALSLGISARRVNLRPALIAAHLLVHDDVPSADEHEGRFTRAALSYLRAMESKGST